MWFKGVKAKSFTELDMSAFDKSQGEYHLSFYVEFLKAMGVPDGLADYWYDISKNTTSRTCDGNIAFNKDFQFNSGNATTICQNTISAMDALKDFANNKSSIFKVDDRHHRHCSQTQFGGQITTQA